MRNLLVSTLHALGIERVTTAQNGEEAIQILRPPKGVTGASTLPGFDLVLADYVMPVVDGGMLLRWVRLGAESPDRFLPFVMISAAADRDVIFDCRDAGVDEFLAKPFSANSIVSRLVAVVEAPRPFIYCPNYFGPDRRRQKKDYRPDRRKIAPDDIETVYSGKDLAHIKNSKKRVWVFRLPKSLKTKLSGGRADPNEPAFDPALIEAANQRISNMETDYADWVTQSVKDLTVAHKKALENPQKAEQQFAEIHRIALELRGQGGIFGYPLVTQFGKSLFDISGDDAEITPELLDLIDSHINLVKIVISQKIAGDGGETGKELLKSLSQAKRKFVHSRNEAG